MERADYEYDIADLEAMVASRPFQQFYSRAKRMEAAWIEELVSTNNEETRGSIKAVRKVFALPDLIVKEMRQAMAKMPREGA